MRLGVMKQECSMIVRWRDFTPLNFVRHGPLEKLWGGGGGEFSSCRNCFSLSNSLYEFVLAHSMNIF